MPSKFNITKEELFTLFIVENKTRKEVSEYYGCSSALIKQKCKEYGFKKPKYLENKNKERRLEKQCFHCKSSFEVVPFRYSGKWETKFCSPKCSSDSRFLGKVHKRKMLNAIAARRRANMKNAIVPLTEEEKSSIMKIYRECPDGYEVDHIIPISKGGTHHPDNLQYLTMEENRKKSNKCSKN